MSANDGESPGCATGSLEACVCFYDDVCCGIWDELCDSVASSFGCTACFAEQDGGTADGGRPEPAPSSSSASSDPAQCDLAGTFAVAVRASASSLGKTFFGFPVISASSNRLFEVLALLRVERQGAQLVGTVQACGATWPDFSSSIGETYAEVFPNALWDELTTRWTVPLHTDCLEPGCAMRVDRLQTQLGTDLPDGLPWPSARDAIDVASLRDEDESGLPGVMVQCRGPNDPGPVRYTYPPTSALLLERVTQVEVGFRFGTRLAGALTSCDGFAGDALDLGLGVRAFACRRENGLLCNTEQLDFIDDGVPDWTLSEGRYAAVRVAQQTDCGGVRELAKTLR